MTETPDEQRRRRRYAKQRSIRIDDELWEAAQAAAKQRNTTVSAVLVKYLRKFAK